MLNLHLLRLQTPRSRIAWVRGLFIVAITITAGCGDKGPKMAPVKGTVTIDGKPAAGAKVAFYPTNNSRPSGGVADASGNFELFTKTKGDGALVGDHAVTVTLLKPPPASKKPPPDYAIEGPPVKINKSDWIVPEKYSVKETSGLTAQVKAGTNDIKFDLKSK